MLKFYSYVYSYVYIVFALCSVFSHVGFRNACHFEDYMFQFPARIDEMSSDYYILYASITGDTQQSVQSAQYCL